MNRNPFGWPQARPAHVSFPVRAPRPGELPGAVPGWPTPRLPSLEGARPYDPPVANDEPAPIAHAILGQGDDVEHHSDNYTVDCLNGCTVPIYKTSRPWRGIDVWIAPVANTAIGASSIRVLVFGVTNGVRALVARSTTDSLRFLGVSATLTLPIFVCAAREPADSYEVVLETEASALGPAALDVQVTVAASDKCTANPRPNDAALFRNSFLAFESLNLNVGTGEMARVVGASAQPMFVQSIEAVNTAAAARWLMLFDAGIAAVANGTAPRASFLMTPNPQFGSTLIIDARSNGGELLRDLPFFVGPRVIASSTSTTLTAVSDVAMTGFCR